MGIKQPKMWIMKINPRGSGNTSEEVFKNLFINEGGKKLIGYMYEAETNNKNSYLWKEMVIGDLIIVMNGRKLVVGVVELTSNSSESNNVDSKSDWFYYRREAKLVKYFNPSFSPMKMTGRNIIIRCVSHGASAIRDEVWGIIQEEYIALKRSEQMQDKIEILKYKKQIILQGPPGTGKTWLAKEIAKELTKAQNTGNPESIIDNFFKTFDATKPEVKEKRKRLKTLLEEFYQLFPKEKLSNLTLDRYALGLGNEKSFCNFVENKLKELSLFQGGFAMKFYIYWSKKDERFVKIGFLKEYQDEEAMRILAEQLSNIANNNHLDEAFKNLGKGLILKILYTYNPDIYFPINSQRCIDNALRLMGFENENLNLLEKNKKLQELFIEKKKQFNTDVTSIEFVEFLFDKFNMHDEISLQKNEIITAGEYEVIQFHPAYSYEDFVRGITAKTNENSQLSYDVQNKVLVEYALKALANRSSNYVLIIDEINRANLPAVLGELIYALEYRGESVESMYDIGKEGREDREIILPENLFIIGTMNTADRSVGHIDYALRRRFAFVDILPDEKVIDSVITDNKLKQDAKSLFKKVSELFYEKKDNNEADQNTVYLQVDFKAKDVQLGHSYFLAKDLAELKMKLEYEIKPLLREYIKDGILSQEAELEIEKLVINE